MKTVENLDIQRIEAGFTSEMQNRATQSLENGKVLYFPTLAFDLSEYEKSLLSPDILDPKAKNISYDPKKDLLGKAVCSAEDAELLRVMLKRYADFSLTLLTGLIPHYTSTIIQGKTSLRPVEILGRKTSYRKDDTRLHVDAFPSNPMKGKRILRVFTNINPSGKPRVWRTGEPFADVVQTMAPRASHPIPGMAHLLKFLHITKDLRSPYDHYMAQIHDHMKRDTQYQKEVFQEEIHFPPGSSWIVYTDQVSHAALSGQHVLEQTFYLQPHNLKNPESAPLAILERYFEKKLT